MQSGSHTHPPEIQKSMCTPCMSRDLGRFLRSGSIQIDMGCDPDNQAGGRT